MNKERIQSTLTECMKLLQDPERARAAASLLRYDDSEALKEDLNALRSSFTLYSQDINVDSLELEPLKLDLPEIDFDLPGLDFDTEPEFELPDLIL